MMDRFHIIDDAAAILVSKGVYRQAKVYSRGTALFAAYGSGFVRLYRDGTSMPGVRCEALDVPGFQIREDVHRRLELADPWEGARP